MNREFEEIVVKYPPEDLCVYPEYKGKPYFSIKYKEGNEHFIGYGTYKPEVLSRFLRDYFMPHVKPIVHAHWIRGMFANMICSNCNSQLVIYDQSINKVNYCPHCGAKMDELWMRDREK